MVQRVAIVGGGIAGLTLAAALDPRAFEVSVHEARPERARGGAALGVWRAAERALHGIGVTPPPSLPARACGLHHISGRRLTPLRPLPVGLVERAALLACLAAAVPAAVAAAVAMRHEEVIDPALIDADLVVGGDGVRSRVRGLLAPAAAERRATPYVATRGILRGTPTTTGEGEYWGRGLVFGRQQLNADDTYWFSAFRDDSAEPLDAAAVAAAAPRRHFSEAAPLVRETLAAAGDAAHAATPNLGRAACSVILDAVTLARALNDGRPLSSWQRRRIPLTQAERRAAGAVIKVAAAPWH